MNDHHGSDRRHFLLIAALAFGAVVVALVSQHAFDMQPCPWCIVQRIVFVAVGIAALTAALWPRGQSRSVHWGVSLAIGLLTTLGAASALWQQLFAAKSSSCVLTVADTIVNFTRLATLMPEVFEARASCAEASVKMLGLPYAVWSLLLFLLLSVVAMRLHLEQRHRRVIRDSGFGGLAA